MLEIKDLGEDEITFEDIPAATQPKQQRPVNPLDFLPLELRDQARKLPADKAHTVLDLKPEGSGHNDSLLTVASICHKMGVTFDDTLDHLQAAYSVDRMDYESAPKRAVLRVWGVDGDLSKLIDSEAESSPDAREEMLIRFRRTPRSALVELSPGKLATKTIDIINRLFAPSAIINIQRSALEYGTLVKVSGIPAFLTHNGSLIEDFKFLNPATFKNIEGVPNTKHPTQKVSTRCNDNVKTRTWMVLEHDPDKSKDAKEKQIESERFNTFAMDMAKFAPLVLAIDTGGKSTHFWFDATGVKLTTRRAFFNLACLHGADPRLAVKSQIARMPNTPSAAEGRGPQKVVYYDPDGEKTPDKWDLKGLENFIRANKQLEYYYNGETTKFLTRDNVESWVTLDRTALRSHLAEKGYRGLPLEGELISPMDIVINSIQLDKNVEAVLVSASGRHAGLYEENGHRVIVKKSPVFITARKGKFPTIASFLKGLLGGEPDQLNVFLGWLSDSAIKLRNDGKRKALYGQAQMPHFAGPPNAGKSLLLQDILTPCFASRAADASPLFKKFPDMHNADTFGAELLYLDDSPVLESGYAFRQEFGERIKAHTVGVGGSMRAMFQGRINMPPWWRFVRLMNLEPATLATLPPLDEGIEDKLILFRCESMEHGPLGKEMLLPGWYERIAKRMREEMPAFIHYLVEEFKLPEHLKDPKQRFPTISYKSDELMLEIAQGGPETYIQHRIDSDAKVNLFVGGDVFTDDDIDLTPWTGTADQLYDVLAESGARASQMRFGKACPSPRILLAQLRNIEKASPHRIQYSKRAENWPNKKQGSEYWIVYPPDERPIVTDEQNVELGELF